jgi:hypothetical protein
VADLATWQANRLLETIAALARASLASRLVEVELATSAREVVTLGTSNVLRKMKGELMLTQAIGTPQGAVDSLM